jgi:hypothetical protein
MKKILLIFLVFIIFLSGLIFLFVQNKKSQLLKKFVSLDKDEKIIFFKKLNKDQRMQLMSKFIQNRTFDIRPVSCVKFYSDGDFICDGEAEDGGMVGDNIDGKGFKYFTGRWIFRDNTLIIENPNIKNADVFGKYLVLDDVYIEEDKFSAHFIFHILKGKGHDGEDLANQETDMWGGITDSELKAKFKEGVTPAIDSYTKLKQAKSNNKK